MSDPLKYHGFYKALNIDTQEIRLLTILPAEPDAPLECSLSTVSLLDSPQYDALSYVWGDPSIKASAFVRAEDGLSLEMQITTNLHSALTHIRACTEGGLLVIWADALCINQHNIEERGRQVNIMRQIFSSAASVRIWIGFGDVLVQKGCAVLADLPQIVKMIIRSMDTEHEFYPIHRAGNCDQEEEVETYMTLVKLFLEPYWKRAWILQEATANGVNIIHYGNYYRKLPSWTELYDAGSSWHDSARSESRSLASVEQISAPTEAFHIFKMIGMEQELSSIRLGRDAVAREPHESFLLEDLDAVLKDFIRHFAKSSSNLASSLFDNVQATDPRDLIYAVREIFPLFAPCEPDYSRALPDLYAHGTFLILEGGQHCNLHRWQSPVKNELPSWSIDFRVPFTESNVFWIGENLEHYNASALSCGQFNLRENLCLGIGAFCVAEISTVSYPRPTPLTSDRGLLSVIDSLGDRLRVAIDWLKRVLIDWLNRALIDDGIKVPDPTLSIYRTLIADIAYAENSERRCTEDDVNACISLCEDFLGGVQAGEGIPSCQLVSRLQSVTSGSSFIVTNNGSIGVAPPAAEVGDYVAIFASGNMPFVIRPAEPRSDGTPTFRLIGMCYIDGIMDGEAVRARAKQRFGDENAVNEVFDEMITLV